MPQTPEETVTKLLERLTDLTDKDQLIWEELSPFVYEARLSMGSGNFSVSLGQGFSLFLTVAGSGASLVINGVRIVPPLTFIAALVIAVLRQGDRLNKLLVNDDSKFVDRVVRESEIWLSALDQAEQELKKNFPPKA